MLKMLSTVAVAAATSLVSLPAAAEFMDFQVSEGSVPGTPDNTITADKINGSFVEWVTLDGLGGFTASAYAQFTSFLADEGATSVSAYLNNFGDTGYRMYALFSASGTVSGLNFTGLTGQFDLYIDADNNTTFTQTGGGSGTGFTVTGTTADDYKIAFTTTLTSGTGTLTAAPGAYDFKFTDFTLTDDGKLYFTEPDPFYINVQVNGDNDAFTGTNSIRVTGDVSAVFIPEPGSLALAGLALGAMGLVSRRRRSS